MRPVDRPGLKVLGSSLTCRPGRIVGGYSDGWGTAVDIAEIDVPHAAAHFEMTATVETFVTELDSEPAPDEWALYTRDSLRVPLAAIEQLGWNVGGEGATWTAVESALAWMPQRFLYQVGATDAETPIDEMIALGAGVCQDFSHVFLAMLRNWGWCARYVSGYLFSAEPTERQINAEAMHAWVEVYRPGLGWIGLDATAGRMVDERYVVVGIGRDYDDARPVRGVLSHKGAQHQESHLTMVQRQQQQ